RSRTSVRTVCRSNDWPRSTYGLYMPSPATSSDAIVFADLFAGVGGFAAALTAMGGKAAYAVEIDPAAARVYESNWQHSALGDITEDANDEEVTVPEHSVLTGGFPCQPF